MSAPTLPVPTDAARRGIGYLIDANFVAQNVNITRAPQRQEYPDQEGAIRAGKEYDQRYNLSCTVYAKGDASTPPFNGKSRISITDPSGTVTYWALDDVQESGTYNDVTRWTVTAHRHEKPTGETYPTAEENYAAPSGTGT